MRILLTGTFLVLAGLALAGLLYRLFTKKKG